jgi:hypothetical protein
MFHSIQILMKFQIRESNQQHSNLNVDLATDNDDLQLVQIHCA